MATYLIGVDLGTTSTKVVLFNTQGQVVTSVNNPYPLYQDTPDMAEEDPEEIFDATIAGLTAVIRRGHVQPGELAGVSFSAAMHSLILMDANDKPLTRVITWADNRAAKYATELKENGLGMQLFKNTGVPTHPMSPMVKLLWLNAEHPDLIQQTTHFIGIKDYILHRLYGRYVQDYSLANATGLFNIHTMDWDDQALAVTHVSRDQLPELVDTTYQLTGMKAAYADVIGIDPATPFILGASDGTLSNLGVNAIDPGVLAVTIGTSGAVRVVTDKPVVDPQGRLFTYYLAPGRWVVGGPVNNGGIVFRWVRDQLFAPEKLTAEQMDIDSYELLTTIASKIPAGADGLLFHPYLGGERAPIWDANARGSFFGLTRQHTRAHMVRAALEGIVYNLYMVMLMIEGITGKPKAIQATGGFARSALWRQMLADIFEQDVNIPESFESSALGAAVIAMKSLGMIDDLSAVKDMVGVTHTHQPNPAVFPVYRQLLPIWIRLTRELSTEYAAIADFQRAHPDPNAHIAAED
ncbi:gluconokinase [Schleiferilactobacillus harbinensis]|jgi:gluconokinase|uniref:Gluconokinase n=3 Tax=Schleiferilactobacillus harbinensis TaxID=304207 RepID=A0ABU7T0W1_9LACO|nr:gluconokinase [Schleiferilactobacillus harbinensis]MCI1849506.1 gluconokinase [Schleiferilactobacillus harbinensis]MCT2909698.1 gluconokinase [Schleiferilactobacillus harbinensis]QEU48230.1 gluconokinase [Schleiferilactobacillus harbinensis]GEK05003.1 gluconate kinase [Schleiferilactobacillus harbinensis]